MINRLLCIRLVAILAALVVVPAVSANDCAGCGKAEFARVDEFADGKARALQMAITTYISEYGGGKISVDLVGAIHIGDASYYQNLNDKFTGYDKVLFELIVPESGEYSREHSERGSAISKTQVGLKNMLGLAFQLEEIDYGRENFVHADLTTKSLSESMEEREESLYVYFWRAFYASMDEYAKDPLGTRDMKLLAKLISGNDDSALKTAFAYEMTDIDRARKLLGGGSGSAIIESRNEHAVSVLRQQIDSGVEHLAVFYGVAHMPDLEERLVNELNLKYSHTVWVDAWDLSGAAK